MRILVAYDSISPHAGGAQETALRWVRNLTTLGVQIKLLCDQGINQVSEGIKPDQILLAKSLDGAWFPGGRTTPFLLTNALKKQILDFNPDFIHIHEQLFISTQLPAFAKKHGIPLINSFHGNSHKFKAYTFPYSLFVGEGKIANRFLQSCQTYMLKNADYLTAPTQHYCNELRKITSSECFLLPYPIAHRFFIQPATHPKRVTKLIAVSRLTGEKNVHVLIEMMKYLKDSFTLTVVGDGMDKAYLQQRVKQLGVHECVTFKGWLNNTELPKFLSKHDLFLSPSDFETFGITYIEALAVHLPCVVFDYPVAREVIPNKAAVFVPTLDPKEWAKAVQKLQDNHQLYKEMKKQIEQNYPRITVYEEEHSTKKLMEIYTNLLKTLPRPHHR